MTQDWRDAIVKLTHLGYSVRTSGDSLHVKWKGNGEPPSKEKFSSLVGVLKEHKEDILKDPHFLIDQTLREIDGIWQSGFLNYLKFSRLKEWGKMLGLEERINRSVLKGDLNELKKSLVEYRELITGIMKQHEISSKQKELSFQQDACRQ
jgi:hypothetical protein